MVLLARPFEDVLGTDEAMGHKPPKPVWNVNNVVVSFFFVLGGHDLADIGTDRWVVSFLPVQDGGVARGGCVEVILAPRCHDM